MSTADHATCCCAETIDDIRALEGFYEAALHDRNELAGRLNQSAADLRALEAAYRAALHDRDEIQAHVHDLEVGCGDAIAARLAIAAACGSLRYERDDLARRLTEAIAERDRARDTAARLEAELARGFQIAAPDITLTRTNDGAPGTPDVAVPGPSGAPGRPGSENTPTDTYPHESGPESPSA